MSTEENKKIVARLPSEISKGNLAVFDQNGQPIPTAGLLTSTQTTSRQIQVALKLIW